MGKFVTMSVDASESVKGEVNWKPRLNTRLEDWDYILTPVGYVEKGQPVMQVNQDNTILYINQVADELDGFVVNYDQDPPNTWTWFFREKFGDEWEHAVETVGMWACKIVTLYPLDHVVENYVRMNTQDTDYVPLEWT